jgi:hypothetical protein
MPDQTQAATPAVEDYLVPQAALAAAADLFNACWQEALSLTVEQVPAFARAVKAFDDFAGFDPSTPSMVSAYFIYVALEAQVIDETEANNNLADGEEPHWQAQYLLELIDAELNRLDVESAGAGD